MIRLEIEPVGEHDYGEPDAVQLSNGLWRPVVVYKDRRARFVTMKFKLESEARETARIVIEERRKFGVKVTALGVWQPEDFDGY